MARRKISTKKRASKKAVSKAKGNTPEKVLQALLKSRLDLGVWRPRIEEALGFFKYANNPLDNPPQFILDGLETQYDEEHRSVPFRDEVHYQDVRFGHIDGEEASFAKYNGNPSAILKWGCRVKRSEKLARDHWPDNVSAISGVRRHHAKELIDYCAVLAKHLGWKW